MPRTRAAMVSAASCAGLLLAGLLPTAAGAALLPLNPGPALPAAVCALPLPGLVQCRAQILTDAGAAPVTSPSPAGLNPADFQSAYHLPSAAAGQGQTVAIVAAADDPTAEADLGVYRSQFNLPACTTANGCFRKVNQSGAPAPLPVADQSWAIEISLDLQAVSAVCPNCHLLLVESNSPAMADMAAGIGMAATLKATEISNSFGLPETPAQTSAAIDGQLTAHPGVVITAGSGDTAQSVQWPATSPAVTAVGGTTLTRASNARGWSETAWSGAGSGCSVIEAQPSWQAGIGSGCTARAVADVSADADPATGASVYDSTPFQAKTGWFIVGGTSLSSPLIAGVYALAGNGASVNAGSYPYAHANSLNVVPDAAPGGGLLGGLGTLLGGLNLGNLVGGLLGGLFGGGSGGATGPPWNGPAGLGSPNGTGAF